MNATTVVARDLCDMRATASKVEIDLKYAGKALGDAFKGERDETESRHRALQLLRAAGRDIAKLIAEIEGVS